MLSDSIRICAVVNQISNKLATEYAVTAVWFLNLSPTGNKAVAVSILIDESKHNDAAIVSGYMLWFTKYRTGLLLNMLSEQCGSLIPLLLEMKQ